MIKRKRTSRRAPWFVLAAAILWWGCGETPTQGTDMTTEEILVELSAASTLDAAVTSIRNVFAKSGVGIRGVRTPYEPYDLAADEIAALAAAHLDFIGGSQEGVGVGDMHDALEAAAGVSDGMWRFDASFDDVMRELREQGAKALANPEVPEHALLVMILANGPALPTEVPTFVRSTTRSPVQAFLLTLWARTHFHDRDPAEVECRSDCMVTFVKKIGLCFAITSLKDRSACLRAAESAFKSCLDSCHDQGAAT